MPCHYKFEFNCSNTPYNQYRLKRRNPNKTRKIEKTNKYSHLIEISNKNHFKSNPENIIPHSVSAECKQNKKKNLTSANEYMYSKIRHEIGNLHNLAVLAGSSEEIADAPRTDFPIAELANTRDVYYNNGIDEISKKASVEKNQLSYVFHSPLRPISSTSSTLKVDVKQAPKAHHPVYPTEDPLPALQEISFAESNVDEEHIDKSPRCIGKLSIVANEQPLADQRSAYADKTEFIKERENTQYEIHIFTNEGNKHDSKVAETRHQTLPTKHRYREKNLDGFEKPQKNHVENESKFSSYKTPPSKVLLSDIWGKESFTSRSKMETNRRQHNVHKSCCELPCFKNTSDVSLEIFIPDKCDFLENISKRRKNNQDRERKGRKSKQLPKIIDHKYSKSYKVKYICVKDSGMPEFDKINADNQYLKHMYCPDIKEHQTNHIQYGNPKSTKFRPIEIQYFSEKWENDFKHGFTRQPNKESDRFEISNQEVSIQNAKTKRSQPEINILNFVCSSEKLTIKKEKTSEENLKEEVNGQYNSIKTHTEWVFDLEHHPLNIKNSYVLGCLHKADKAVNRSSSSVSTNISKTNECAAQIADTTLETVANKNLIQTKQSYSRTDKDKPSSMDGSYKDSANIISVIQKSKGNVDQATETSLNLAKLRSLSNTVRKTSKPKCTTFTSKQSLDKDGKFRPKKAPKAIKSFTSSAPLLLKNSTNDTLFYRYDENPSSSLIDVDHNTISQSVSRSSSSVSESGRFEISNQVVSIPNGKTERSQPEINILNFVCSNEELTIKKETRSEEGLRETVNEQNNNIETHKKLMFDLEHHVLNIKKSYISGCIQKADGAVSRSSSSMSTNISKTDECAAQIADTTLEKKQSHSRTDKDKPSSMDELYKDSANVISVIQNSEDNVNQATETSIDLEKSRGLSKTVRKISKPKCTTSTSNQSLDKDDKFRPKKAPEEVESFTSSTALLFKNMTNDTLFYNNDENSSSSLIGVVYDTIFQSEYLENYKNTRASQTWSFEDMLGKALCSKLTTKKSFAKDASTQSLDAYKKSRSIGTTTASLESTNYVNSKTGMNRSLFKSNDITIMEVYKPRSTSKTYKKLVRRHLVEKDESRIKKSYKSYCKSCFRDLKGGLSKENALAITEKARTSRSNESEETTNNVIDVIFTKDNHFSFKALPVVDDYQVTTINTARSGVVAHKNVKVETKTSLSRFWPAPKRKAGKRPKENALTKIRDRLRVRFIKKYKIPDKDKTALLHKPPCFSTSLINLQVYNLSDVKSGLEKPHDPNNQFHGLETLYLKQALNASLSSKLTRVDSEERERSEKKSRRRRSVSCKSKSSSIVKYYRNKKIQKETKIPTLETISSLRVHYSLQNVHKDYNKHPKDNVPTSISFSKLPLEEFNSGNLKISTYEVNSCKGRNNSLLGEKTRRRVNSDSPERSEKFITKSTSTLKLCYSSLIDVSLNSKEEEEPTEVDAFPYNKWSSVPERLSIEGNNVLQVSDVSTIDLVCAEKSNLLSNSVSKIPILINSDYLLKNSSRRLPLAIESARSDFTFCNSSTLYQTYYNKRNTYQYPAASSLETPGSFFNADCCKTINQNNSVDSLDKLIKLTDSKTSESEKLTIDNSTGSTLSTDTIDSLIELIIKRMGLECSITKQASHYSEEDVSSLLQHLTTEEKQVPPQQSSGFLANVIEYQADYNQLYKTPHRKLKRKSRRSYNHFDKTKSGKWKNCQNIVQSVSKTSARKTFKPHVVDSETQNKEPSIETVLNKESTKTIGTIQLNSSSISHFKLNLDGGNDQGTQTDNDNQSTDCLSLKTLERSPLKIVKTNNIIVVESFSQTVDLVKDSSTFSKPEKNVQKAINTFAQNYNDLSSTMLRLYNWDQILSEDLASPRPSLFKDVSQDSLQYNSALRVSDRIHGASITGNNSELLKETENVVEFSDRQTQVSLNWRVLTKIAVKRIPIKIILHQSYLDIEELVSDKCLRSSQTGQDIIHTENSSLYLFVKSNGQRKDVKTLETFFHQSRHPSITPLIFGKDEQNSTTKGLDISGHGALLTNATQTDFKRFDIEKLSSCTLPIIELRHPEESGQDEISDPSSVQETTPKNVILKQLPSKAIQTSKRKEIFTDAVKHAPIILESRPFSQHRIVEKKSNTICMCVNSSSLSLTNSKNPISKLSKSRKSSSPMRTTKSATKCITTVVSKPNIVLDGNDKPNLIYDVDIERGGKQMLSQSDLKLRESNFAINQDCDINAVFLQRCKNGFTAGKLVRAGKNLHSKSYAGTIRANSKVLCLPGVDKTEQTCNSIRTTKEFDLDTELPMKKSSSSSKKTKTSNNLIDLNNRNRILEGVVGNIEESELLDNRAPAKPKEYNSISFKSRALDSKNLDNDITQFPFETDCFGMLPNKSPATTKVECNLWKYDLFNDKLNGEGSFPESKTTGCKNIDTKQKLDSHNVLSVLLIGRDARLNPEHYGHLRKRVKKRPSFGKGIVSQDRDLDRQTAKVTSLSLPTCTEQYSYRIPRFGSNQSSLFFDEFLVKQFTRIIRRLKRLITFGYQYSDDCVSGLLPLQINRRSRDFYNNQSNCFGNLYLEFAISSILSMIGVKCRNVNKYLIYNTEDGANRAANSNYIPLIPKDNHINLADFLKTPLSFDLGKSKTPSIGGCSKSSISSSATAEIPTNLDLIDKESMQKTPRNLKISKHLSVLSVAFRNSAIQSIHHKDSECQMTPCKKQAKYVRITFKKQPNNYTFQSTNGYNASKIKDMISSRYQFESMHAENKLIIKSHHRKAISLNQLKANKPSMLQSQPSLEKKLCSIRGTNTRKSLRLNDILETSETDSLEKLNYLLNRNNSFTSQSSIFSDVTSSSKGSSKTTNRNSEGFFLSDNNSQTSEFKFENSISPRSYCNPQDCNTKRRYEVDRERIKIILRNRKCNDSPSEIAENRSGTHPVRSTETRNVHQSPKQSSEREAIKTTNIWKIFCSKRSSSYVQRQESCAREFAIPGRKSTIKDNLKPSGSREPNWWSDRAKSSWRYPQRVELNFKGREGAEEASEFSFRLFKAHS